MSVPYNQTRGFNWNINQNRDGSYPIADAQLSVLMDIREALHRLNAVFACPNAQAIPDILRRIDKNTTKRPRKVKK